MEDDKITKIIKEIDEEIKVKQKNSKKLKISLVGDMLNLVMAITGCFIAYKTYGIESLIVFALLTWKIEFK